MRGAWLGPEAIELVPVHGQRRQGAGPAAGRDRRQGAVDQGTRCLAAGGRDRFCGAFGQGCRDRCARRKSPLPPCCRARMCAMCWSARLASPHCRPARGSAPAPRAAPRNCCTCPARLPDRAVSRQCRNAAGQAGGGRGRCDAAGRCRAQPAGRERQSGTPLDAGDWLPAPGQGAIAIECRADDAATRRAARRHRPCAQPRRRHRRTRAAGGAGRQLPQPDRAC